MKPNSTSSDKFAPRNRIRMLLADDQPLYLRGLSALFTDQDAFTVIGEISSSTEMLPAVQQLWPDVLVTDLQIHGKSTLNTIQAIRRKCPGTQVFVLTAQADFRLITEVLAAGATGFGLKVSACDDLLRGVHFVSAGHRYISRDIDQSALDRHISNSDAADDPEPLTDREREVLELVTRGLTSKEIATQLGIGRRTVESHSGSLLSKLGVRNKAQLVRLAIVDRLVTV